MLIVGPVQGEQRCTRIIKVDPPDVVYPCVFSNYWAPQYVWHEVELLDERVNDLTRCNILMSEAKTGAILGRFKYWICDDCLAWLLPRIHEDPLP